MTHPNNRDACSQPDETDIRISAEALPSGDALSPRADNGQCFGSGVMTVRYRILTLRVTEYW